MPQASGAKPGPAVPLSGSCFRRARAGRALPAPPWAGTAVPPRRGKGILEQEGSVHVTQHHGGGWKGREPG